MQRAPPARSAGANLSAEDLQRRLLAIGNAAKARNPDGFVDELERTRAAMRGLLHNITLLKTNPYGMEVMREIGDLSHPGYAPAKGGSEAPRWQVIARAVQAAEPFLQRIMIVRQLFGDPPFAYGPDFLWAGRPPFRSVNMASVRDATMGFL